MFYDIFVKLCQQRGVSPSKAAEDVGMSRTSVVKWKNGSVPSGATAQKIAAYFNVSVDYLLGKKEQKEKPVTLKDDELSEPIIILNRGARKMTLEQQKKLLDVARVMFEKEFRDE